MTALEMTQALQQLSGGDKPNPAAIAVRLGLRLRPVVGALYSFDGAEITYDANQPLVRQREDIARACLVHMLGSRVPPQMSLTAAARDLFDIG